MIGKEAQTGGPSITEAQSAVRDFLQRALSDVSRVNVTRVAKLEVEGGTWEAEADVWQPNPTIQALHLDTQRPVLDEQHYLVRLDNLLNVVAYELARSLRNDD